VSLRNSFHERGVAAAAAGLFRAAPGAAGLGAGRGGRRGGGKPAAEP
jgi:hypothetical protein